jgi:hypothetical protein
MKQFSKEQYENIKDISSEIYHEVCNQVWNRADDLSIEMGFNRERKSEVIDLIHMAIASELLTRGVAIRTYNHIIADYSGHKTTEEQLREELENKRDNNDNN